MDMRGRDSFPVVDSDELMIPRLLGYLSSILG